MWKYKIAILLLLLLPYILLIQEPLFGDEGLYSIAIKDNIELGLQPTATYFGEVMYWKPSLMFNVYAIIASPFYKIVPEEILFRTISLLFVAVSLFVLFKFFKNEFNEEKAYLGLIIILISPAFFGFSIRVLTDTIVFLFFTIVLYASQKFEKYNKLFFLFSLVGIGLSKSIVLSILGIGMAMIYYFTKNKKINYEMIILGIISIIIIFGYSELIGINKLNSGDLSRIYNNISFDINEILRYLYSVILYLGITLLAFVFYKDKKNPIYLFILLFIVYLILNRAAGLPWYIFPILPFITLLFLNIDLIEKKELIIILLIWNIFFINSIIGGLILGNFNYTEVAKMDFDKTIYIGRLGEVVANKMYDYNCVVVTPQNSFRNVDRSKGEWYGSREEMTKENILGLIYDYENPKWYPKYLGNMTLEDRYIPPITRTYKNWEGPFEQIIIEEQYYIKVKDEILKDYNLEKIIDEEKETQIEEKIYILSIKEKLE
ncbi:MAG TPA: glycosyltransferase family 39 protein [Bacteroidales bacterium]|nr:glycosyltransferase family 39 protein [Bacteroidales bacterium]